VLGELAAYTISDIRVPSDRLTLSDNRILKFRRGYV